MNIAYIDNQNLYTSTNNAPEQWHVDMKRFRVFLAEKFDVAEAYLFMGAYDQRLSDLYSLFQRYGYILEWRAHGLEMRGDKKGNVDTDLVFSVMRDLIDRDDFEKVFLVSGNGDYFRLVEYLITKGRFGKILFPSRHNASSLYKRVGDEYHTYLDGKRMKRRFALK